MSEIHFKIYNQIEIIDNAKPKRGRSHDRKQTLSTDMTTQLITKVKIEHLLKPLIKILIFG